MELTNQEIYFIPKRLL